MYNPNFTGNPQKLIPAAAAGIGGLFKGGVIWTTIKTTAIGIGSVIGAPAAVVGGGVAVGLTAAYLIKKKKDKEKNK